MSKFFAVRGLVAVGLGCLVVAPAVRAQQAAPAQAAPAQATQPGGDHGDLPGPIDSVQDIQDTGKMLFKLADTNNDGQISQKEAVDAGNLLVGGFFFRADANGDGTITADEARQAREALFRQQPLLRFVLQRGKAAAGAEGAGDATKNPANAIGTLLDSNQDKKLAATEVRQAVQTAVQGLYATADTNRDGQMSMSEINAALIGAGRSAMQASFQQADTDRNGQISKAEFDKAIIQPANVLFGVLDANGDGQISQQEAESAQRIIASQARMLHVPNAGHGPVPTFATPRTGAPGAAPAPAPGATPAPAPR